MDEGGLITDRRAGRISTEKCTELCNLLDGQVIDKIDDIINKSGVEKGRNADYDPIKDAYKAVCNQLGTLGGGNHFCEV